ncbi:hypothetical protein SDC9_179655 [bioreactor metagenome]|uniref:Uncharacterized protein n=1 Tax=bioreactor metagenome TaxID=1076179 RepID=A0A645H2G9_9ZZZZ
MRATTLDGISSMTSTVSSIYISSSTSRSSLSEKAVIRTSCKSASMHTKVSAASSLGRIRNMMGRYSSGNSASNAARSAGFISFKMRHSWGNFFSSSRAMASWFIGVFLLLKFFSKRETAHESSTRGQMMITICSITQPKKRTTVSECCRSHLCSGLSVYCDCFRLTRPRFFNSL